MFRHVFVGVGSNLGNPRDNCSMGIEALAKQDGATVSARSSLYVTAPLSSVPQPDYINCAARISWGGDPMSLLRLLMRIEEEHGRKRDARWGPRTLDLDILLMDDLVLDDEDLIIPHPRLHERKFALVPCLEIDPDLRHPRLGQPLRTLLQTLGDDQSIIRLWDMSC